MIYPRLDKIRNGQRMSVELVNGLIKRTEYAADLLRQYKPLAGTNISIAQRYDGATISGGGAGEDIISGDTYINGVPYIFFYSNGVFTDIQGLENNVVGGSSKTQIAGSSYFPRAGISAEAFLYQNGGFQFYQFTSGGSFALQTEFYGFRDNIAVGFLFDSTLSPRNRGLIVNTITSSYETFVHPNIPSPPPTFSNTYLFDVYENKYVGGYSYGNSPFDLTPESGFILENGLTTDILPPGSFDGRCSGIYENTIIGQHRITQAVWRGFIYENGSYTSIMHPEASQTFPLKIKKNKIVGYFAATAGGTKGFIYDKSTNSWETIVHPLGSYTSLGGIA